MSSCILSIASFLLAVVLGTNAPVQDGGLVMNAESFGVRPDGKTMNTTSIQHAIDYIHQNGGGTLEFGAGKFLTGPVELKSNVSIRLDRAAVIAGSTNPYDYLGRGLGALISADGAENIGIVGDGTIEGGGRELVYNIISLIHNGIIQDGLRNDRPNRPRNLLFKNCRNLVIQGISLRKSPGITQEFLSCEDMLFDHETVDVTDFWNNDGIDISDCKRVKVLDCFFNSADDGIVLGSEAPGDKVCEDIEIRNCTVRSSANGLKFGTVSWGGYRNIKFVNCKIYDTFRSAINFATPDGAFIENILVDSLDARNVGNGIVLRLSRRRNRDKVGTMKGVTISNSYIEVCAGKPDRGYSYEGPVEDFPRNVCPCEIMGIPGRIIEDVTIRNVHIVHPGGGDPFYAYSGVEPEELDAIPEYEDMYPDFSKYKELPAWGFFIRHVKGLEFENVTLEAGRKDYRPAYVMVDVGKSSFTGMKVGEPDSKGKEQFVLYRCSDVDIEK